MDIIVVILGVIAIVAALRYALKIRWGWALVIAVALAKLLNARGVGR